MSLGAASLAYSPGQKPAESLAFLRCLYDITHGNANRRVYVEHIIRALNVDEADAEFAIETLVAEELVRLRLHCILSITQAGIDEVNAALHHPEPRSEKSAAKLPQEPSAKLSLGHTLLGAGILADGLAELPFELPPPVIPQQEHGQELNQKSEEEELSQDDDDRELRLICEAIGLNPNELDGKPSPPPFLPQAPETFKPPTKNITVPEPAPPNITVPQPAPPLAAGDVARTLTAMMLQLPKLGLAKDDRAEAEAEIATATAQLLSPRPKRPIIAAALTRLLAILDAAGPTALPTDLQVGLTEIRLLLTELEP